MGPPPRSRPGPETARDPAPLRRAGAPRRCGRRLRPDSRARRTGSTPPRDRRAGDAARPPLPLRSAPSRSLAVSRRALRTAAALALLTFDLWHVAFGYHGAVDRRISFFPTRLTDFLRGDAGHPRVVPLGRLMPPNLNLPYEIPSVMSYDAIDSLEQAVVPPEARRLRRPGFLQPRRSAEAREPEGRRARGSQVLAGRPREPAARHPGVRAADGLPVLARLRPARRPSLRARERAAARTVRGPRVRRSGPHGRSIGSSRAATRGRAGNCSWTR